MAAEGEGEGEGVGVGVGEGEEDEEAAAAASGAIREALEAAEQRGAKRSCVAGIEGDRMNLHITLLIFLSPFFSLRLRE